MNIASRLNFYSATFRSSPFSSIVSEKNQLCLPTDRKSTVHCIEVRFSRLSRVPDSLQCREKRSFRLGSGRWRKSVQLKLYQHTCAPYPKHAHKLNTQNAVMWSETTATAWLDLEKAFSFLFPSGGKRWYRICMDVTISRFKAKFVTGYPSFDYFQSMRR